MTHFMTHFRFSVRTGIEYTILLRFDLVDRRFGHAMRQQGEQQQVIGHIAHMSQYLEVAIVSRSGYQAWCTRRRSTRAQENARLEVAIHAAYVRTRQMYGPERRQAELHEDRLPVGIGGIQRLRKKLGLWRLGLHRVAEGFPHVHRRQPNLGGLLRLQRHKELIQIRLGAASALNPNRTASFQVADHDAIRMALLDRPTFTP
jgi:hypothetical protein